MDDGIVENVMPAETRKEIDKPHTLRTIYKKLYFKYIDLKDRKYTKQIGVDPLPPALLRYAVHNAIDIDSFLEVGKKCRDDIVGALKMIDRDMFSFSEVLDFGIGCGRTLRWFSDHPDSTHFYGTDIDPDAISWCNEHLKFAFFSVNNPLPPLKYPSEMFDLIYSISVITHLSEDYQFKWLEELNRVTKPGGIVLLSFHGPNSFVTLLDKYKYSDELERKGFIFILHKNRAGLFPEWYQAAFHTLEYIYENFPRYFNILEYVPGGMNVTQDLLILEKN